MVDGQRFEAWARLFSIDEPVYMEMLTEFMSTYTFDSERAFDAEGMITFRYLGSLGTLSLAQFAQHLDLYTPEEIDYPLFTSGATSASISTSSSEAWSHWSPRPYFSGIKATLLSDPVIQILHKLLACSIYEKHTTNGRVSELDVALMGHILDRRNIQVAYLVAQRISQEQDFGPRRSFMGAVITRLIRRMGLLRTADVSRFQTKPGWSAQPVDYEFLKRIEVLNIAKDGTVYIRRRASDPEDVDRLVPDLVLPRGVKKRKQQAAAIDSDEDESDAPPAPPPAAPPTTGAGPSSTAPRVSVPGYIYHYGTPPGADYWYWLMFMQVRCYRAL